jgi:hypothetical protein
MSMDIYSANKLPSNSHELATAVSSEMLSEQKVFHRVEEMIEQLDKKHLLLQKILQSLRKTPHSARLRRNLNDVRVDAVKLANNIHTQFRFITIDSEPDDTTLRKFEPLSKLYAAVSHALHTTCIESMVEIPPSASDIYKQRSALMFADRVHSLSVAESPVELSDGTASSDDVTSLVEVHGRNSYETTRRQADYMHLSRMVHDIALTFRALQDVSATQQTSIDATTIHVNLTQLQASVAETQLRLASRYTALGTVLTGGAMGAVLGGPLGAIIGMKTGLVSLGVGAGLAGATGLLLGVTVAKTLNQVRSDL